MGEESMAVEPLDWLMPEDLPAALASLLDMTASSRCAPCKGSVATSPTVQQQHTSQHATKCEGLHDSSGVSIDTDVDEAEKVLTR